MLSRIALLTYAAAVAAAPTPEAAPLKVPITGRRTLAPRANGDVDTLAVLQNMNATLHKYKASFSLPTYADQSSLLRRATAEEALTDQVETGNIDELYYGPVTVGASTPQVFTADYDTGSADFFVPGPSCGTAQGCVGTTKYSQTGTDEKNTTSVTYGSGSVSGENYFDTVTVAGLTADHTNVISLTQAAGFSTSDSNSLMGMAFSTIANSKQPTFFENLMSQGVVTADEFSFFLGRAASGTQGQSEMTLGGSDSSKYTGSFTQVPVTTKGYWQTALDNVQVSGVSAGPTTKGQSAIDTGTTILLAPTDAALAIFALIPGAFPVPLASGSPTITVFAYPCNTKKTVSVGFAGKQFAINPLDMSLGALTPGFASFVGNHKLLETLLGPLGGGFCLASIAGADIDPTENLYVVGDTFIKNWYSVFSYNNYNGQPSVSFAKSI